MTFRPHISKRSGISKLRLSLMHCLAWLCFIVYELGTLYFAGGNFNDIGVRVVFYILNITLFYVNAYIAFAISFRMPRHYLYLVLFVIAELVCYILAKYSVDYFLLKFRIPLGDVLKI